MKETSKEPIIIDLDRNLNSKLFNSENLIHHPEIMRVEKIIKDIQTNLSEQNKYEQKDLEDISANLNYYHNTITISGTRGSGKTSFLRNILNPQRIENALILPIIDPTLIEEKAHIFLYIVSLIKDQVYLKKKQVAPDKLRKFDEYLRNLAEGMPMLDGLPSDINVGHWNDAQYFLTEGLGKVNGSIHLTRLFRKYINYSLELLGKRILIIAFDDVDTDFGKGFPVLETIRKYLTAPNIITLLSGDLSLYSLVVRKKQWANYGKTLLKNEYDNDPNHKNLNEDYPELTIQLESQYTMKVFKPEYRISLSTLSNKLSKKTASYRVRNTETNEEVEITTFYKQNIFKKLGIYGGNMYPTYLNFILSLPIRTQLSIMKIDLDESLDIAQLIASVFYSELKASKVEVWDFVNGYGMTNAHLLKLLLDNKILDEGSQFVPKANKPILDSALFATGVVLTEKLKYSPFEIFDHIIRVSNVVDKADKWVLESEIISTEPSISEFVKHSRCMYDYGLRKIASLQNAYISSYYDGDELFEMGLIHIYGLNKTIKRTKNPDAIDAIFRLNNKLSIYDYIGYFPAMRVVDERGVSKTFYSIYNLFGAIGDLLRVHNDNMQNEHIENELKSEFTRLGQLRDFSKYRNANMIFASEYEDTIENDESETDETTAAIENNDIDKFITEFKAWADKAYNLYPISPYLIGRIMVRTSFSFGNINRSEKVEDILDTQIRCFLNAVLVEETMEHFGTSGLTLTNPTNSRVIYRNNQKQFESIIDKAGRENKSARSNYLYDFISTCPLIKCFTYDDSSQIIPIFEYNRNIPPYTGTLRINTSSKKSAPDVKGSHYLKYIQVGSPEENGLYSADKKKYILAAYLYNQGYKKQQAIELDENTLLDILKNIYYNMGQRWSYKRLIDILNKHDYKIDSNTPWK